MEMDEYFYFRSKVTNLLFEGWNSSTAAVLLGICLCFTVAAILLEAFKFIQSYLSKKANMNPLTYAKTQQNLNERSHLIQPLLIPSSIKYIRSRRIKYLISRTLLHIIQVVLGYFVMLAVMSYNAWLLIAIALGSGAGYLVFGTRFYEAPQSPCDLQSHQSEDQICHTNSAERDRRDLPGPSTSRPENQSTSTNN